GATCYQLNSHRVRYRSRIDYWNTLLNELTLHEIPVNGKRHLHCRHNTNTIELTDEQMAKVPNLKVLSVAELLAKSIEAISTESPISDVYTLFEK
ncbi:MAG: hypothetical protein II161_00625, partial [Erysipelotrichaceae bacterium]|nr:hypothetical protein [Erysipelotrichaceae bacterium]